MRKREQGNEQTEREGEGETGLRGGGEREINADKGGGGEKGRNESLEAPFSQRREWG